MVRDLCKYDSEENIAKFIDEDIFRSRDILYVWKINYKSGNRFKSFSALKIDVISRMNMSNQSRPMKQSRKMPMTCLN